MRTSRVRGVRVPSSRWCWPPWPCWRCRSLRRQPERGRRRRRPARPPYVAFEEGAVDDQDIRRARRRGRRRSTTTAPTSRSSCWPIPVSNRVRRAPASLPSRCWQGLDGDGARGGLRSRRGRHRVQRRFGRRGRGEPTRRHGGRQLPPTPSPPARRPARPRLAHLGERQPLGAADDGKAAATVSLGRPCCCSCWSDRASWWSLVDGAATLQPPGGRHRRRAARASKAARGEVRAVHRPHLPSRARPRRRTGEGQASPSGGSPRLYEDGHPNVFLDLQDDLEQADGASQLEAVWPRIVDAELEHAPHRGAPGRTQRRGPRRAGSRCSRPPVPRPPLIRPAAPGASTGRPPAVAEYQPQPRHRSAGREATAAPDVSPWLTQAAISSSLDAGQPPRPLGAPPIASPWAATSSATSSARPGAGHDVERGGGRRDNRLTGASGRRTRAVRIGRTGRGSGTRARGSRASKSGRREESAMHDAPTATASEHSSGKKPRTPRIPEIEIEQAMDEAPSTRPGPARPGGEVAVDRTAPAPPSSWRTRARRRPRRAAHPEAGAAQGRHGAQPAPATPNEAARWTQAAADDGHEGAGQEGRRRDAAGPAAEAPSARPAAKRPPPGDAAAGDDRERESGLQTSSRRAPLQGNVNKAMDQLTATVGDDKHPTIWPRSKDKIQQDAQR